MLNFNKQEMHYIFKIIIDKFMKSGWINFANREIY